MEEDLAITVQKMIDRKRVMIERRDRVAIESFGTDQSGEFDPKLESFAAATKRFKEAGLL